MATKGKGRAKKVKHDESPYSLFVHRNNVLKMLKLRHYILRDQTARPAKAKNEKDQIKDEDYLIDDYEAFKEALDNDYDPKATRRYHIDKKAAPDEEREIVIVRYIGNKLMKVADFVEEIENPGLHYIFIADEKNTTNIDDTTLPGISHEFFYYSFFAIYAPDHFLTGTHRIMSEEEKIIFLARTALSEEYLSDKQLPRISIHDAMVRYLGAQLGDLIRTDTFDTSLKFYYNHRIYFRIVADIPILYTTSETMEGEEEIGDDDEQDENANVTQGEDLSEL